MTTQSTPLALVDDEQNDVIETRPLDSLSVAKAQAQHALAQQLVSQYGFELLPLRASSAPNGSPGLRIEAESREQVERTIRQSENYLRQSATSSRWTGFWNP